MSIPDLISAGYLPVLAIVSISVAFPLCISGGPYTACRKYNGSVRTYNYQ